MVHPAHEIQPVQFQLKSVFKEGHFNLEVEMLFRPISPMIEVGSLSNTTLYTLRMH
jgi:hypothetical protein